MAKINIPSHYEVAEILKSHKADFFSCANFWMPVISFIHD